MCRAELAEIAEKKRTGLMPPSESELAGAKRPRDPSSEETHPAGAHESSAKRSPTVVLLGDTGAGKSSLLNALLRELLIVPTSGIRACTAAIIELSAHELPGYASEVEFVSKDEWQQEETELMAALRNDKGQLVLERPAENSPASDAYWQLRSIYGQALWDALQRHTHTQDSKVDDPRALVAQLLKRPSSVQDVAAWLRTQLPEPLSASVPAAAEKEEVCWDVLSSMNGKELEEVLGISDSKAREQLSAAVRQVNARTQAVSVLNMVGQKVQLSTSNAHELHKQIKPFVDSADEGGAASMWPLVRRVVVRGPWTDLIGRTTLVDAPGVQDENSSRGKMVQTYLRQADSVWLVSNIRRAVNDKSTKDMMPPTLRQRLLNEGRPGAMAFVATQTDVLVRSEITENLGLPKKSNTERCALERNAYTKRRLILDFYSGGIDFESHPAAAAQHAEVSKHTGPMFGGNANRKGSPDAANGDDVIVIDEGPSKPSSTPPPSSSFFRQLLPPGTGVRGGSSGGGGGQLQMSAYMPPSHKAVAEAAAQGKQAPAHTLAELVRLLSAQESALCSRRAGSANGSSSSSSRSVIKPEVHSSKKARREGSEEGAGESDKPEVACLRRAVDTLKSAEEAWAKEGYMFPVFTVSAIDGEKLEGIRQLDGPPSAFTRLEDTDLPALREHVISLSRDNHFARQRALLKPCADVLQDLCSKLKAAQLLSPPADFSAKLERAVQVVHSANACLDALQRVIANRERHSKQQKPGMWMHEAVSALRAQKAAEEEPP